MTLFVLEGKPPPVVMHCRIVRSTLVKYPSTLTLPSLTHQVGVLNEGRHQQEPRSADPKTIRPADPDPWPTITTTMTTSPPLPTFLFSSNIKSFPHSLVSGRSRKQVSLGIEPRLQERRWMNSFRILCTDRYTMKPASAAFRASVLRVRGLRTAE